MKNNNDSSGVASRLVAIEALESIFEDGDFFDSIAYGDGFRSLSPEDKSLVRATVYNVLRNCDIIDTAIRLFCERPIAPNKQEAMQALRVGFAQIFIMQMADYAVVDSVVAAVKETKARYLADLVNAVLRSALRELKKLPAPNPQRTLPEWLWQSWVAAYGKDVAAEIANASLMAAPLDINVRAAIEAWNRKLGGQIVAPEIARIESRPDVAKLAGFSEGMWWVQDVASSIPARLLPQPAGKKVLEIGAAPGGKTAQLAVLGADVTALDRSARRLDKLKENMARLKLKVQAVAEDVFEYEPKENFDAILLDAPCSATGTMRRHPEIPFIRRESDVHEMQELQSRMLDRAAGWVKVGGVVIYCVCSLQAEEGEAQVKSFLERHPEYARMAVQQKEMEWLGSGWLTADGDVRTLPSLWPDKGGMDGFFVARLMRHS